MNGWCCVQKCIFFIPCCWWVSLKQGMWDYFWCSILINILPKNTLWLCVICVVNKWPLFLNNGRGQSRFWMKLSIYAIICWLLGTLCFIFNFYISNPIICSIIFCMWCASLKYIWADKGFWCLTEPLKIASYIAKTYSMIIKGSREYIAEKRKVERS